MPLPGDKTPDVLLIGGVYDMDFGIRGKSALVCAASKGLGKGCALALAREGVNVTLVARGAEALNATAEEIRRNSDVKVTIVAADISLRCA
jgi:3-oxoacyl-[acyl-carrier protein] reductase